MGGRFRITCPLSSPKVRWLRMTGPSSTERVAARSSRAESGDAPFHWRVPKPRSSARPRGRGMSGRRRADAVASAVSASVLGKDEWMSSALLEPDRL